MIEHKGFMSNTMLYCEYKNSKWEVEMVFSQGRSTDLENWERKEASVKAMDVDLNKAVAHATLTMSAYLEKVGGDLFKEEEIQSGDERALLQ